MAVVVGLTALYLGIGAPAAPAQEHQVEASMHTFSDSNDNRVSTWVVQWIQPLARAWRVQLRGAFDRVDLPPLPGLPGSRENVDAITAASRPVASVASSKDAYAKTRREIVAGIAREGGNDAWTIGGAWYHSIESDWTGRQASLRIGRNLAQQNTNLAVAFAHGFDDIAPDADTGGSVGAQSRRTEDLTFTWTQVLSPRWLAQLGFETTWVRGFQSNPYRQVWVGGARQPETHPESRFRRAVFAQVDRYLMTHAAASLLARWYGDDWGVQAGTLEARLQQYIRDTVIVRYRYRFHRQSAAWFQRDLYTDPGGVEGLATGDYKLEAFDSNLFGVKLTIPFEGLGVAPWMTGIMLDVKYERYFDSRSFAANVVESGLGWSF